MAERERAKGARIQESERTLIGMGPSVIQMPLDLRESRTAKHAGSRTKRQPGLPGDRRSAAGATMSKLRD